MMLGKYSKLTVLSTLAEPKSLSELGRLWYRENGRFYKKKALAEIDEAVAKGFLRNNSSKYWADVEMILKKMAEEFHGDMRKKFLKFWSNEFSIRTFLSCEVVSALANKDPAVAARMEIDFPFKICLAVNYINKFSPELFDLVIGLSKLESYISTINNHSERNFAIFKNLREATDWKSRLDSLLTSYSKTIKNSSGLKLV